MRIDILTLFPASVDAMMNVSILGRAQERGYITIKTHQIRDYTTNKQMQVDDYPYGGGRGAVMQADPLYRCWAHVCEEAGSRGHTIYLSPCGRTFTQSVARELKDNYDHLILVCGHYEGIDQRFIDECVDEELSMGDFVVTGGEIPAMAVTDAICRMVPGVLPEEECFTEESHWAGLLEYPQYSRPDEWHGRRVPDVLLSGHHENVAKWRKKESYKRTMLRRPDLWAQFDEKQLKTKSEKKVLAEAKAEVEALRAAEAEQAAERQAAEQANAAANAAAQRRKADIDEFAREYPDVARNPDAIPKEVWDAVAAGSSLTVAYAKYTAKQAREEAERTRSAAQAAHQNVKNAARSTGSMQSAGQNAGGRDPFLEGWGE